MRSVSVGLSPLLTRSPTSVIGGLDDVRDRRRRLLSGGFALVEDSALSAKNAVALGHSAAYQIALPYFGAFTWSVGSLFTLIDANRTLFIKAGEDFRETHPIAGVGHASIIITPKLEVLDELCCGVAPQRHAAFQSVSRPLSTRARLLAHKLLNLGERMPVDQLWGDELAVQVLHDVITSGGSRISRVPARIVDQAKQLLHARCCEPIRLDDIAREIGVTGVYLTQSFTRAEGVPLYRYLMHLRLSRALVDLPHRESITDLALDLGFSSHSHFTAAFRSSFGLTPSEFRTLCKAPKAGVTRRGRAVKPLKNPSSARR